MTIGYYIEPSGRRFECGSRLTPEIIYHEGYGFCGGMPVAKGIDLAPQGVIRPLPEFIPARFDGLHPLCFAPQSHTGNPVKVGFLLQSTRICEHRCRRLEQSMHIEITDGIAGHDAGEIEIPFLNSLA